MARWLGIADETVFGTPVTPPTTFLDCLSVGLHPERADVVAESAALIGPSGAAVGSYKILGEVELIPNSENIMKLLKFLLGTPTTTQDGAASRYKHVFDPSDTLKFGTLYKVDDVQPDGLNALQYTSVIALECRLEAALDAYVSTRFSLLGQKDAKVSKPTVGAFSTIAQFFSLQGKMYYDVAQTLEEPNIDSVSLTYARAIPDDFYGMNDAFLKGFIPGLATLEGSADLLFKSWTAHEKFWGATAGPIAAPALAAMSFDFTGPSLGGTGEFTNHRMKWQLPALIIPSVEAAYEKRDKIVQTVNFKGARGVIDATQTLCRVTLINSLAAA